jgi:transposase
VARRHHVAPNERRHLVARGGLTAAGSGEEVVPAYRALQNQVRALHRLLGKKTLEAEIFQRHGPKGFAMLWPETAHRVCNGP